MQRSQAESRHLSHFELFMRQIGSFVRERLSCANASGPLKI